MFLISQIKATEMLQQTHFHVATGLKVLALRLTSQRDSGQHDTMNKMVSPRLHPFSLLPGLKVLLLEQLL